ncbi:SAM-dependent methyltransferase [Streptantibioticus silvisoli]|uniref:Class I SAM-dependent methyltransferase n=1 Tax=Streptantibioticus silvisoli TaxID=2705255 RepID=A0ABT6W1J4_9ACTN|nr:class I SAM-dependent methyltransferase [Streptantibioticus silvisoli]MDI5964554.1 class I SAM-dependent methyltransferase [Streptantibioticus silvisoli]
MDDNVEQSDPVAVLEGQVWALAAVVATLRETGTGSLEEALAADPVRTAVLEAAGVVRRDGEKVIAASVLQLGPAAANVASARLSSMRQAVAAAGGEAVPGWDAQGDDVLVDQGRASAGTGHALATRVVPALSGLADRLALPGSRVLDIGTGTAALALALAQDLPHVHVTGIDYLERAVRLARRELDTAGPGPADRVEVRHQDAVDLRERDLYDLVWLPAPFLSQDVLDACLPHVAAALTAGGWLVAGTNAAPREPLLAAVAEWTAARNGGSALTSHRMSRALGDLGFQDLRRIPTVPGGPVLVAGRRPDRAASASHHADER